MTTPSKSAKPVDDSDAFRENWRWLPKLTPAVRGPDVLSYAWPYAIWPREASLTCVSGTVRGTFTRTGIIEGFEYWDRAVVSVTATLQVSTERRLRRGHLCFRALGRVAALPAGALAATRQWSVRRRWPGRLQRRSSVRSGDCLACRAALWPGHRSPVGYAYRDRNRE